MKRIISFGADLETAYETLKTIIWSLYFLVDQKIMMTNNLLKPTLVLTFLCFSFLLSAVFKSELSRYSVNRSGECLKF